MENDSTVYVGMDVHKDSITVAYALGTGEVELLGKIGTTKTDICGKKTPGGGWTAGSRTRILRDAAPPELTRRKRFSKRADSSSGDGHRELIGNCKRLQCLPPQRDLADSIDPTDGVRTRLPTNPAARSTLQHPLACCALFHRRHPGIVSNDVSGRATVSGQPQRSSATAPAVLSSTSLRRDRSATLTVSGRSNIT